MILRIASFDLSNRYGRFVCQVTAIVFLACWSLTVYQAIFRSSLNVVYPASIYPTKNYVGPVAGPDYGQVYFSSRAWFAGESPFKPKSAAFKDPLDRMPAYSLFTLFVFSPLNNLEFESALRLHLLIQISIYFSILAFAIWGLRRRNGIFLECAALFVAHILFTPIGITFLQMGQYDLYVAAAYLIAGSAAAGDWGWKRKWFAFAIAGVLAGIKLTALPLLGFLSIWELLVKKSWASLAIWIAFGLTIAPFPAFQSEYLEAIRFWESGNPAGLSFHCFSRILYLPDISVYLAFISLSILSAHFVAKKKGILGKENEVRYFILFFAALSIFSVGLGKVAYEYRQVGLLGTFSLILINSEIIENKFTKISLWIFTVFFIFSMRPFPFQGIDETIYASVYLITSMILFYIAARSLTEEGKSNAT